MLKSTSPAKIIYLVCSVGRLIEKQGSFYFSDGHATDSLTTFYDKSRVTDLLQIIDWNAVKASYWGGEDNLIVKRKKQAEFLVSEDVAPDIILGFGCYNDSAKNELLNLGINMERIKVIQNAYY